MILWLQYVTIQYTSSSLVTFGTVSGLKGTGIPVELNAKMPLYQPI